MFLFKLEHTHTLTHTHTHTHHTHTRTHTRTHTHTHITHTHTHTHAHTHTHTHTYKHSRGAAGTAGACWQPARPLQMTDTVHHSVALPPLEIPNDNNNLLILLSSARAQLTAKLAFAFAFCASSSLATNSSCVRVTRQDTGELDQIKATYHVVDDSNKQGAARTARNVLSVHQIFL